MFFKECYLSREVARRVCWALRHKSFFERGRRGWSKNTCLGMGMWRPNICVWGVHGICLGTGGPVKGVGRARAEEVSGVARDDPTPSCG